jgi:uncharacterized protein (DUF1778 family)
MEEEYTIRDRIAIELLMVQWAQVLEELLDTPEDRHPALFRAAAQNSYGMADAMMEARGEKNG